MEKNMKEYLKDCLEEKVGKNIFARARDFLNEHKLAYSLAAGLAFGEGLAACGGEDNSDGFDSFNPNGDHSGSDDFDDSQDYEDYSDCNPDIDVCPDGQKSPELTKIAKDYSGNKEIDGYNPSSKDYGNIFYDDISNEVTGADLSAGYESSGGCRLETEDLSWRLNAFTADIPGSVDNQRWPIQYSCETWAEYITIDCRHIVGGDPRVEEEFQPRERYPCSKSSIACVNSLCGDRASYNDDRYFFTTNLGEAVADRNKMDLESVSLHEFGHILGLPHTSDSNAVMYRHYKPLRNLTSTDIEMLRELY